MEYLEQFQGRFVGVMQWDDCKMLLAYLIHHPSNWYVYDTLDEAPNAVSTEADFINKITCIKHILTTEHQARYCGIVYVDHLTTPSFVKIFHPHHLGKSCGSSDSPPIPRWLLSKTAPQAVTAKSASSPPIQGFLSKYFKL